MPLDAVYDPAPVGGSNVLLVMLPGTGSGPQDLLDHGFVRELRQRCLPVDAVAVDAHLGLYLDRSLAVRLAEDIVAPARARGLRVWLFGISLGGMGVLLYARTHPADIDGVILLAPFLGARGTIAHVLRAGGLDRWQPGDPSPDDDERVLLTWLKTAGAGGRALPTIHLGYGTRDRYAAASAMLAARVPADRVVTIDGEHDWATWLALWQRMLDHGLFATAGNGEPGSRAPAGR